jgi:nitroreductase
MFRRLGKLFQMVFEYLQDMWQFTRYNSHSPLQPKLKRIAFHTVIETHTLEKGLALPRPRAFFGVQKIRTILNMQRRDSEREQFPREMLLGALSAYLNWNKRNENGFNDIVPQIEQFIEQESSDGIQPCGGVREVQYPSNNLHAQEFLKSRYSSRVFDQQPLQRDVVEQIVAIAQKAPSQCNRQSSKVHVFVEQEKIQALLELQGGSKGFADYVPTLFVVTSEITAWGGPQQRNQLYVDGGLFSMQLMLAMHALGVLNCPLNLAVSNSTEWAIKRLANIPSDERLIMMIAAGFPPEMTVNEGSLTVAASPRRPIHQVLFMADQ